LTCAWEVAKRGARVRVIDPGGPGAGASGGVVGALAPHVPERWTPVKAFQLDCLLGASAYWAEIEEAGGGSAGYARTGRVQPILDDAGLERAIVRSQQAATLWRGAATWRVIPALSDWSPLSPTGHVVHDTLSARLSPMGACRALVAALSARGAEIVGDARDEGAVIEAMGAAGLEVMSTRLGKRVGAPIKGQAAVLGLDRRSLPQIFVDGIHVVPHADGTVAVGSTSEREFGDPHRTDDQLDDVVARACAAVPDLCGAPIVRRWAGLRPRARSRGPMVGPIPATPGRFVANGGFKIGLALAPGVARLLVDLVLEGQDAIPDAFRVEANL